jgi:hypothetical protein
MSEQSPVICEGCGKPFATLKALGDHQTAKAYGRVLAPSNCYRAGMQALWSTWWEERWRERIRGLTVEQMSQLDPEADAEDPPYRRQCDICHETFYALRRRAHICYRVTCVNATRRQRRGTMRIAQSSSLPICGNAKCRKPITGKKSG